ncbi:metallophosphoesterase family protein [Ramlibacter albus]|uniref:Metallophosphoesterase n=1 Tax=Ramlibacter albus TaxID=2079448 RepID=A0A923M7Y7_9BURK|nr:metallophosphoesterase [Ramlibacter albus]MBC5764207.1 metallophosphoesterase [Ramlibacter albus]
MSTVLHISDTHFGTEDPPVVEALRALVREQKFDALILSGDITQRARSAQFAAAREFCDSLGIAKRLTLPGNHDIPLYNVLARVAAPYRGYMAAFGEELNPVLELPDAIFIGVNTTRPERHKDGEVSREQIERVANMLRKVPRDHLRVVVTHQPACVMRPEDEKDRLHGGGDAVKAWSEAGADLVLGGHIHLPYVSDVCAVVKETKRPMYCIQAGTALSLRVRHNSPNSVNVIRWVSPAPDIPRVCKVERWDYDLADGRFELTHPYELKLDD